MCRLAAYLGKQIRLHDFFSGPEHSLVVQSYNPKEMDGAVLNADGFGIGWYNDAGEAVSYKQTLPAWSDSNIPALGSSLVRDLWVANVRSATPGQLVHIGNTQPFIYKNIHFLHNGYIESFQQGIKETLIPHIDPDILAAIQGDTDSGWLAALFHQQLKSTKDIASAIKHMCRKITSLVKDRAILMNLLVSDGQSLFASKHAIHANCPSLYYLINGKQFPESAILASERFDDDSGWVSLDNHHMISIHPDLQVEIHPIA